MEVGTTSARDLSHYDFRVALVLMIRLVVINVDLGVDVGKMGVKVSFLNDLVLRRS